MRDWRSSALRQEGRDWVRRRHPPEKQINAALGLLTAEEVTAVKTAIGEARTAVNDAEAQVQAAAGEAEVAAVTLNLP